jgi:hypothetical protein
LVVWDANSKKQTINWGHQPAFIRSIYRVWITQAPKLLAPYQRVVLTRFCLMLVVMSGFVILMQLAYPGNRSLPMARLDGNGLVGFSKESQIHDKIKNLNQQTVVVETQENQAITTYEEMGVSISASDTFKGLSDYSLPERLIPFSIFLDGVHEKPIAKNIDAAKFEDFTKKIITDSSRPYIDARVKIKGVRVEVSPAQDGYAYHQSWLQDQLENTDLFSSKPIYFTPEILHPKISTSAAKEAASNIQNRINKPMSIKAEETTKIFDSKTLASWIKINHLSSSGAIKMNIDKDKVARSLEPIEGTVNLAPSSTKVTLLNGFEAGRVPGESGKRLKFDKLVSDVAEASKGNSETVWAIVEAIPPSEIFERRYTRDSMGLQSLISHWTQIHPGRHGVAFSTLDGQITAGHNSNAQFDNSGLNGMYIASQIYNRIQGGSLNASKRTSAGYSVSSCLYQMIFAYSNTCRSALGSMIGWGASNNSLASQGFSSTSLSLGGQVTTPKNALGWLEGIMTGSVVSRAQGSDLIGVMSGQINRQGIPSGSLGIPVANQAGISSSGIIQDTAVVFHPRDNYALSVFAQGVGWSEIADLAREINKVLHE